MIKNIFKKNKILKILTAITFLAFTGSVIAISTAFKETKQKVTYARIDPMTQNSYVRYNRSKVIDAKGQYTIVEALKQVDKEIGLTVGKSTAENDRQVAANELPLMKYFDFKFTFQIKEYNGTLRPSSIFTHFKTYIWINDPNEFTSLVVNPYFYHPGPPMNDPYGSSGEPNQTGTFRFVNLKKPPNLKHIETRPHETYDLSLKPGTQYINNQIGYLDINEDFLTASRYKELVEDYIFPDYIPRWGYNADNTPAFGSYRGRNKLYTTIDKSSWRPNKDKSAVTFYYSADYYAALNYPLYTVPETMNLHIDGIHFEKTSPIAKVTIIFNPRGLPPEDLPPPPIPESPDNSQPSDKPTDNNGNTGDSNNNPSDRPDPNAPDNKPPSGNPDSNPNDNTPAPDDSGNQKPNPDAPLEPEYNPNPGNPDPNNGDNNGVGPDGGATDPNNPDNKPENNENNPPNQDNNDSSPDNPPIVNPPPSDNLPNENKPDPNSPSDPQDGNKPDPNVPNDNPSDTTKPDSGDDPTIDNSQSPSDENYLSTSDKMSMGFVMTTVSAAIMGVMLLLFICVMLCPFGKK